MTNRFLSGIAVGLLGLLISLVPARIFPPCTKLVETVAGGAVPMKCFWSGQAEIGIGLLVLCGGVLLMLFKQPLVRMGIGMMTALTGVLGILIPTVFIGGCEMETMPCRIATFPALVLLNSLVVLVSLAAAAYIWIRE